MDIVYCYYIFDIVIANFLEMIMTTIIQPCCSQLFQQQQGNCLVKRHFGFPVICLRRKMYLQVNQWLQNLSLANSPAISYLVT